MNIKVVLLALIVVILIAVCAVYALSSGGGYVAVNGPTRIALSSKPVVFRIGSQEYSVSLASTDNFSNTASIYLHVVPIFTEDAYNIALTLDNTTHVNVGTKFANMGIQLNAVSNGNVQITIFPIQQYASTQPDSASIQVVPGSMLLGQGGGKTGSTVATTIASTTTIQPSQSSVSSTTAGSTTTTAPAVNETLAKIYQIANSTYYQTLVNLSGIYAQELYCTPTLYNSSYLESRGHTPILSSDYYNASFNTPNKLTYNVTSAGGTVYAITFYGYITGAPPLNGKMAAQIKVDVSDSSVVSATLSGIYYGLDATSLRGLYTTAKSYSSPCGPMLASVP
jgi:hypothetical protein